MHRRANSVNMGWRCGTRSIANMTSTTVAGSRFWCFDPITHGADLPLAAQINDDGETVRSRTGVLKGHPCLKDELALRAFICRGLERLGLNIESIKSVGRPAGWSADDAE
jgi:hypothetical protein